MTLKCQAYLPEDSLVVKAHTIVGSVVHWTLILLHFQTEAIQDKSQFLSLSR